MANQKHLVFKASDRSYFAILKKEIHALAISAGFSETRAGEVDIVVAEMVSNLAKYAQDGQLLVKLINENDINGIEIISMDSGPGMTDTNRMISDGVSTRNTLGHGLGSIKRLSDVFQVYSVKEWGTVMLSRLFAGKIITAPSRQQADIRSVVLAKPGETVSGDAVFSIRNKKYLKLFIGDGLGHGVEAEKAVATAGRFFMETTLNEPVEILKSMNIAVKKTRGLVGTAAVFSFAEKKWSICGVGNIAAKISGPGFSKNYMSYNGIIGLNLPNTMNAQEVPYEKDQLLIMCSDGLKSRWDTLRYYGITRYDLSVLATAVMKDYIRNTDDASVVVCKINL